MKYTRILFYFLKLYVRIYLRFSQILFINQHTVKHFVTSI